MGTRETLFQVLLANGTLRLDHDGSVWRLRSGGRTCTPRRIDKPDRKGYSRVTVGVPGERRTVSMRVHRLVFLAEGTMIPEDAQVDHVDGDKTNNRRDNLEIVDQSTNIRRSYAAGRTRPWTHATQWREGRPVLTTEQRNEIRHLRSTGMLLRDIAARFAISVSHTHRIVSGKDPQ